VDICSSLLGICFWHNRWHGKNERKLFDRYKSSEDMWEKVPGWQRWIIWAKYRLKPMDTIWLRLHRFPFVHDAENVLRTIVWWSSRHLDVVTIGVYLDS
jgi:hypothetical protein